MMIEHTIWTEKYRPKSFSEVKGQKDVVEKVKAFVHHKNMPHIMFSGPAGVGKTTISLVVAHELFGENWRDNFLELNASDERGIDVIRNKVKDFARTRAIGDVPFKIIYLDECDALTSEAQQALRRTMENYTQTCRFILSCNYSSKIIDPIQSRCAIFRFKPLEKEELMVILKGIESSEKLTMSETAKKALIDICEGDVRRMENILQSCAALSTNISDELVYSLASVARPKEIKRVLELALENKFIDARNELLHVMTNYGLSGLDVIKQIQKEIIDLKTDSRKQMLLIEKCGEAEYRISEGSDEFIQLEAFLASVALAGQK
jgi:replication factor C small subunit